MQRWYFLLVLVLVGTSTCTLERPQPPEAPAPPVAVQPTPERLRFTATAYAISGTTKSGVQTRRGIVAADPDVLPLGSRIRVHDAGKYSGEYVVEDTGARINGRIIDIYVPSEREARKFGRRQVHVEIIEAAQDNH